MFLDMQPGSLSEPLTGRLWNQQEVVRQYFERMGFLLAQGVEVGDRVFFHHGNTLEFFVDLLAVWSCGGCAIPIDSRLTPFEVETLAGAANPRFFLHGKSGDSSVIAAVSQLGVRALDTSDSTLSAGKVETLGSTVSRLTLDQPALILFTSGTTGRPKGVVHTHRSLRARWITLKQCLGLSQFRKTLCLLPTHFGHGLICNCLFPWLSGQALHILPPFRSDLIVQLGALIDEHKITFLSSVPTVWHLALKLSKRPQLGTLERVFCGSAPLSAHLWRGIQAWTGTQQVFNAYGITETGSWVAGTTVPDFVPEDGLVGEPWGAVLRILKSGSTGTATATAEVCAPGESGYVWLNTPALMQGYFGRDDLTAQVVREGWFVTGDIGLVDDRGRLYLRGRERDEINKGGMKVYPSDIDAVVEQFEGALDVCTFACQDPLYGEDVGIALVMSAPQPENLRELYSWMKVRLATHQMPVRWFLLDEIPRTSRGKVSRGNVAEECAKLKPLDPRKLQQLP